MGIWNKGRLEGEKEGMMYEIAGEAHTPLIIITVRVDQNLHTQVSFLEDKRCLLFLPLFLPLDRTR